MNDTERQWEEAFNRIILPELKEIRIGLSNVTASLNEMRQFMLTHFERREIEQRAILQGLEKIQQKLDALDATNVKAEEEVKALKAEVKPRSKRVARAETRKRGL